MNNVVSDLMIFFGGFGSAIGTGLVKERFDERARLKRHKLEVARHVLRICNEASMGNFKTKSKNLSMVYGTMNDLEGIEPDLGKILNRFVSLWDRIAEASAARIDGNEKEIKYYLGMTDEIEVSRQTLVSWANNVRLGKI